MLWVPHRPTTVEHTRKCCFVQLFISLSNWELQCSMLKDFWDIVAWIKRRDENGDVKNANWNYWLFFFFKAHWMQCLFFIFLKLYSLFPVSKCWRSLMIWLCLSVFCTFSILLDLYIFSFHLRQSQKCVTVLYANNMQAFWISSFLKLWMSSCLKNCLLLLNLPLFSRKKIKT